jgi:REP element-mobilizing transposase RayT
MPNHFHLVVETPRANLVAGMKWFLGTYTSRFNRRHKLFGHLFSGRYKALIVDGSGNGYLRTVCEYVLGDKLQNCQRRDPLPAEVRCPAVLRFVRFFPEGP